MKKKNEVIKENAFRNSTDADYSMHTYINKSKGEKINWKLNQKMLLKIRSSSQYSTSWCPGNTLAPNICNTLPNENTAKKLSREQTMRKTNTQSFQCTTMLHNIQHIQESFSLKHRQIQLLQPTASRTMNSVMTSDMTVITSALCQHPKHRRKTLSSRVMLQKRAAISS